MTRSLRVRVLLFAVTLAPLWATTGEAQSLPSGWALRTIGSGALSGRATYGTSTYTVEGGGADIWGASDQFAFVYRQITGDVTVIARVASLEDTDPWAKGGVMIRETLAAGSKHAFALVSPSRGAALQWRSGTGGTSSHIAGGDVSAPEWLRIERRSSSFTAFRSNDGVSWTRIGSATISMASSVYVGLAVTSHDPTTRATARFGNVQVTRPLAAALPAGWSAGDIGTPAIGGSASASGSTFTVRSAGSVIWGSSDQFTFAYRQVSGDVDVIARVAGFDRVDEWTKAGVMIRASLRRDSAHASMFATPGHGVVFHRRPGTAFPTLHTSSGSGTPPVWVKLERRGSAITAFRSLDGANWRMIGSDTVVLPSTFYVGLAVASYDRSRLATGTFTNVSVRAAQGDDRGNTPPTVSLTAPAASARFTPPASITIGASAGDADGGISRVQFYRDGTLIATDTSAPYSVNWSNVPAGTYSLTAVAVDNTGASTRSAGRTIYVDETGPATLPTRAAFNPSPDHNTSRVTYYRVEIFTAGADPARTSAVSAQNVGKPAVVNGECRTDIASMISGLPSGSYFAAIRAVGPGGSSTRTLSGVFRR
jgi:regulation of enolase protein 1 (concanavalin A-like superfamily)